MVPFLLDRLQEDFEGMASSCGDNSLSKKFVDGSYTFCVLFKSRIVVMEFNVWWANTFIIGRDHR